MSDSIQKCAELLYARATSAWASEDSLAAVFSTCGRGPTFDRTTHGRAVVQKLFNDSWKEAYGEGSPKPVLADRLAVLAALYPLVQGDYNLFTQVASNLSDIYLKVDAKRLMDENTRLQTLFITRSDVPNPFTDKKSKIKVTAATHPPEVVREYSRAQSFVRAFAVLAQTDFPNLSHRITPLGKTPALADSDNFCMLPALGDTYYHPDTAWGDLDQAFFSSAGDEALYDNTGDGAFKFLGIPEGQALYRSESGGSMLTQAMSARKLAYDAWGFWVAQGAKGPWAVVPRVNSLQVFGSRTTIQGFADSKGLAPTWNSRPEVVKE